MEIGERYSKLLDIAKEDSSEKRRELLHEVTDLFFDTNNTISSMESNLFGELLAKVAFDLNNEVRMELSNRFNDGSAPRALAVALANDAFDIAQPIIQNSVALTDEDLIKIVESKGKQYQMEITKREIVSEVVSDALVNHGDDEVVGSLLENEGAKIGASTFDKVAIRAEANPMLQGAIINRKAVPPEILNELYLIVSGPMRQEILERNSHLSKEEIDAAMKRAEARVGISTGTLPEDFEDAERKLNSLKAKNEIDATKLPNLWREGEKTLCQLIFADISGLDYFNVQKLFAKKDIDGIAMICRAKGFERGLFVTLAVFILGSEGMSEAEKLGQMYNNVPLEAAQRALRFMQVRISAAKAA